LWKSSTGVKLRHRQSLAAVCMVTGMALNFSFVAAGHAEAGRSGYHDRNSEK
jgi:hypothetical protein